MKKRILALLCALILLVQPMGTALAADSVYLIALNETILPINVSTMPLWYGGYLYVHSSIFDNKQLSSIEYVYSGNKQTAVLLQGRNPAIIFDLKSGNTFDGRGNYYPESALVRNGQVYLPAGRVAEFFSLIYTNMKTTYGPMVRFRTNNTGLSDSMLLDAASSHIDYLYEEYQKSLRQTAPIEPTPTVEPTPEQPTEDSFNLYLSFLAGDTEQATMWLDALGNRRATFYFPPVLLEGAGDLSRRMLGSGHTVGLFVDAGVGTEHALEQLREGNRFLSRNTASKTRLAYLSRATPETVAAVEAAGWQVLTPRVDGSQRGLRKAGDATAALRQVARWSNGSSITLWLGAGVEYAGLRALLTQTEETGDRFFATTEQIG